MDVWTGGRESTRYTSEQEGMHVRIRMPIVRVCMFNIEYGIA